MQSQKGLMMQLLWFGARMAFTKWRVQCNPPMVHCCGGLVAVRPDCAIYCTLGNFSKPVTTMLLLKLPNF